MCPEVWIVVEFSTIEHRHNRLFFEGERRIPQIVSRKQIQKEDRLLDQKTKS